MDMDQTEQRHAPGCAGGVMGPETGGGLTPVTRVSPYLEIKQPGYQEIKQLSPWSRSGTKRLFDCVCVLLALPLLLPVLLTIALAVWLTSRGPIFFLQKRMGRNGRTFTMLKFRTMIYVGDNAHHAVTAGNLRFTPIGLFLRRRKLDELPQLLSVLRGDMSLVGPASKIPQRLNSNLPCRPGITGAALVAFALEELVLDRIPKQYLESYYHKIVLPAKRKLDSEYMARATFLSDLKLIIDSVLRRWDTSVMESLVNTGELEAEDRISRSLRNEFDPIEELSGIGLIAAAVTVLVEVSLLTRLDWHYVFLLFALSAGIVLLASMTVVTMVKDRRSRESKLNAQASKSAEFERKWESELKARAANSSKSNRNLEPKLKAFVAKYARG